MAVVDKLSTTITNRDATPKVATNASISKGTLLEAIGFIDAANGDSANSTFRFCSVPSNARISQVLLSCDGGASAGAGNIGVYQTTENGGAVVDADLFASAQALTSALVHSDVTHESGEYGIEEVEKPLWELLGLSADSKRYYDIVLTISTGIDAADTIGLKVRYVI